MVKSAPIVTRQSAKSERGGIGLQWRVDVTNDTGIVNIRACRTPAQTVLIELFIDIGAFGCQLQAPELQLACRKPVHLVTFKIVGPSHCHFARAEVEELALLERNNRIGYGNTPRLNRAGCRNGFLGDFVGFPRSGRELTEAVVWDSRLKHHSRRRNRRDCSTATAASSWSSGRGWQTSRRINSPIPVKVQRIVERVTFRRNRVGIAREETVAIAAIKSRIRKDPIGITATTLPARIILGRFFRKARQVRVAGEERVLASVSLAQS